MKWLLERLSSLALIISGVFLFAMMIHVASDVALKYAINKPIPGTLEVVSAYYMVAGVFLPIAAVELTRQSIAVDVAYQFMPRWMQVFCMGLVLTGSAAVYFMLAYTGFGDAMKSWRINEQLMGQVAVIVWPSRFVLPIGFVLAGLVCAWYLYGFLTSAQIRERLLALHDIDEELDHG
ncbi:TRAP transporter small permease [Antarctobacter sp.]|uniref:TRAP transporter small permease n=1 Tax=Antarctobacter sp. TaxID=1872577 RepID=UPI003A957404